MSDDIDAAADRAAAATRKAVRSQTARPSRSWLPLLFVGVAILSVMYLYVSEEGRPTSPTPAMPAPHIQAPSTPAPQPVPNNN